MKKKYNSYNGYLHHNTYAIKLIEFSFLGTNKDKFRKTTSTISLASYWRKR